MMPRALACLLIALGGCSQQHLVGERAVLVLPQDLCPVVLPPGAFPCVPSNASQGELYDCCGGSLPTQTCRSETLTCYAPEPEGLGVCISTVATENFSQVCVNRQSGDDGCTRWGALSEDSQRGCAHRTQCGSAIYDLTCNDGVCSCSSNGIASGPFPQRDACRSAEAAVLANIELCGAPPLGG